MENIKTVKYEELSIGLKRKVILKYMEDKENALLTIKRGDLLLKAIELWYADEAHMVLISESILRRLDLNTIRELEQEEEFNSFYNLGYSDDLTNDMGMLFI
jgi:hypothetical protein